MRNLNKGFWIRLSPRSCFLTKTWSFSCGTAWWAMALVSRSLSNIKIFFQWHWHLHVVSHFHKLRPRHRTVHEWVCDPLLPNMLMGNFSWRGWCYKSFLPHKETQEEMVLDITLSACEGWIWDSHLGTSLRRRPTLRMAEHGDRRDLGTWCHPWRTDNHFNWNSPYH